MDLNGFRNPPKSARPMARWWWPGLDVTKEELAREVGDLDDSGLAGAELQPFLIGSPPDMEKNDPERARRTHRFMQPYHYEMMAAVLEEAAKRGLIIDITQNSAWPTGGTHISLPDSGQTLLFGETVIRGPQAYSGPVPPLKPLRLYTFFGKILPRLIRGLTIMGYHPEDKKLARVVAGRLLGRRGKFTSWKVGKSAYLDLNSMVDLTDKVRDGQLEWQAPEGRWQVFAFYEGAAGSYPLLDARSAPGKEAFVINHFSEEALRRHLEAFFGAPAEGQADAAGAADASLLQPYMGKTFRAVFTDSFELISPMHWARDFLEEFERRRGYDVTPYLPVTYVPLKDVGYYTYGNELNLPDFDFRGDAGQRIRYDFQRTLSELFIERFICGAAKWMAERGLQSRVQGYGNLADPLQMLGRSHIPETEQLYGGGALHFLKLAGSAASLYSRPLATSETLVWSQRPYLTTPLKWRVAIDRLYESGINQVIYHGFPYRHPDFPYPGYQPFASPYMPPGFGFSSDMSRDNPLLFNSAPRINAYAARAQYLLQASKTRAAVGLFYQLFDYPNGDIVQEELVQGVLDDLDAPAPKLPAIAEFILPSKAPPSGDRAWIVETAALGSELVANGWYYQFFNEDSLLRAEVRDGRVVMGEAEFSALALYKETALPAAAAEKLKQIADAGVPVVFVGSKPSRDPGFFEREARDEAVQRAVAAMRRPVAQNAAQLVEALKDAGAPPQVGYERAQKKLGFIHKIAREEDSPWSELYFLRNRSRKEQSAAVTLGGGGRAPVELNLWNGEVTRLAFEPAAHGRVKLNLTFPGYTTRMIGFMDEAAAAELPEAPPDLRENDLNAVWTLTNFDFSATRRKADGGARLVELVMEEPVDWRSEPETRGLSSGTYSTRFIIAKLQPEQRAFLCFDEVCDRADITLNGQTLPPLLVMPWRVEITDALKEGENHLSITVTASLRNCLVEYGNRREKSYALYRKGVTMRAGLIGPVRVDVEK